MTKKLSIGMATWDDYDGVYFTAQSIRLFHPEITERTEILIIDNHPEGPCAAELKDLQNWISGYRCVPWNRTTGTAVRDIVFREARADFVLCVDSHVLFAPGSLSRLLEYIDANPETPDLLQGPLLYDDLHTLSTHMDPRWSDGMFGVWGTDERAQDPDCPPFEIEMQGLGVFACRRNAWLGFNPRLKGFGGEEGYIHEKFRRAGGRVLCLPFLRWVHRFGRPSGTGYQNAWEDRIRNYLIVARELGVDSADHVEHFRAHIGVEAADRIVAAAAAEMRNPFDFFEAIYCINLDSETARWREVSKQFERVGISDRVRRFSAVHTPSKRQVGRALSHRGVIEEARHLGLKNVLVFEDDVLLAHDTPGQLEGAVPELRNRDWDLLYLGACRWGRQFQLAEGCARLESVGPVTCAHAVAYNDSVYDRILHDVPADIADMERWLAIHHGIDQYYAFSLSDKKLMLRPILATQASLQPFEDESVRLRVQV